MKRFDVTGTTEIDVKRFYIPLTIQLKCPKCNTMNDHNFSEQYLMYPTVNKPESTEIRCKNCDDHFSVNVILKIAIEVDEKIA